MPNNPITDAALAELDRMHAGLRGGELLVQEQMDDGFALIDERGVCLATTMFLGDARFFSRIYSQYPPLRQRLLDAEARLTDAERERDELRESAESRLALVRQLDVLMNGIDGAAKQAALCDIVAQFPRWLAARDAQQRRKGAAEWLEKFLVEWDTDATRDLVSIWDIQQAAQRLREGK